MNFKYGKRLIYSYLQSYIDIRHQETHSCILSGSLFKTTYDLQQFRGYHAFYLILYFFSREAVTHTHTPTHTYTHTPYNNNYGIQSLTIPNLLLLYNDRTATRNGVGYR